MDVHKPGSERSFGLTVGAVVAIISALTWWRGRDTVSIVAAVIAVLLIGGGLLAPAALRIPNRIWWRFALILGWINSRIILSAFFFLVLTPAGVVMRMVGANPLTPAQPGTAWSPYSPRRKDPKHYEHPY